MAERTENEKVHLTAVKEENEKLKEVLQSEINEYMVVRAQNNSLYHCSYSAMHRSNQGSMLLLLWHLNKRFLILLQRMEIALVMAFRVEKYYPGQSNR